MTFRLGAIGGWSNRTQAILSYLATYGEIEVFWDAAVQHYLDVCEPIPGVTFVSAGGGMHAVDYGIPATAPHDWRKLYSLVRPIASIRERIEAFQGSMGRPYAAMHVRRTDMVPLADRIGQRLTSDEEFFAFIAEHPRVNIWLAADNGESQEKFGAIAGTPNWNQRVCIGARMAGRETVRDEADHPTNGPLSDAIVDMWMCRGADFFRNSGVFGTFTGTVEILRSLDRGVIPGGYPGP